MQFQFGRDLDMDQKKTDPESTPNLKIVLPTVQ